MRVREPIVPDKVLIAAARLPVKLLANQCNAGVEWSFVKVALEPENLVIVRTACSLKDRPG